LSGLDFFVTVSNSIRFGQKDEAINACRTLTKEQGLYCGHSSGANYLIAKQILNKIDNEAPQNILILLLDSGMKYNLS
jgi:cystathionine beta-synthase